MNALGFRKQFHAALMNGASYDELLDIVRHCKDAGLDQRTAYDILEGIREEQGCNEFEHSNCDRIEDVMDIVWGFCSKDKLIWTTSLSEPSQE